VAIAIPPAIVAVCGALAEPPSRPDRGRIDARAWSADPERVRCAYDDLRIACTVLVPTPAQEALARFQQVVGVERATLATTAADGLLHKASAEEILELRGSVFRLACGVRPDAHPKVPIAGHHHRTLRCVACGAELRPDVVLPGERLRHLDVLEERVRSADRVLLIGLVDEAAAGVLDVAKRARVHTTAIGPSAGSVDERVAEPIDVAVPLLVSRWLGDPD
jgi:NAD-dependent SIR2 family protein deacetylase